MSIVIKPKQASAIHSAKAKAELQAAIAKEEAKAALQEESPLQTREAIKGFWAQYPKARELFGKIMVKWRGSFAARPSVSGYWAAYPYRDWVREAGTPQRTMQRYLDLLEDHGLIERTHGKHGGPRQLMFIRPTALALKLSNARPSDWEHLEGTPRKPKKAQPKPVQLVPHQPKAKPELGAGGKPADQPQTIADLMVILGDKGSA